MNIVIISPETAILAKEEGFNFSDSGYYYDKKGGKIMNTPIDKFLWGGKYPASTQSLLQKWLREEHKINIDIKIHYEVFNIMRICKYVNGESIDVDLDGLEWKDFLVYEEALEEALIIALKLIKENVKLLPNLDN